MKDIPACPNCTATDQKGDLFRIRPCTAACHMVAAQGKKPLTVFVCRLLKYSDEALRKADAKKAAKHYGISPEHAAGYIRLEQRQRGMVNG